MKKKIQILAVIMICAGVLGACKKQEIPPKKLLEETGLSNVETYLRYAEDYQKGKVPDQDYNCRTAAFTLLEDSVTATEQKEYNNYLMFDVDAIENKQDFEQIRDHQGEFIALFDGASTKGVPKEKFGELYPNALKERKVEFHNEKASLITVVMHDPEEEWLFVGHAGVLVKNKKQYQFFEKLAPNEAYQSKTFASKEELKKELLSRPAYQGDGGQAPLIYENGVLMK